MERLGLQLEGNFSVRRMIPIVKLAEEKGFESVWAGEEFFMRDNISALTAFALSTDKVKLGAGILHIFPRPPQTLAMAIATVDEISDKRAILGLGAGYRLAVEEWFGMRFDQPARRMKEYVKVVRDHLIGKTVTYEGQVLKIHNSKLDPELVRESIPIYIGATGPLMLRVGGEVGDGVILNSFTSVEFVEHAIQQIKIGAEKAGRDIKEIDLADVIVLSVSDDREIARESVKSLLAFYFNIHTTEYFIDQFKYAGIEDELSKFRLIKENLIRGDNVAAEKKITDSMIDSFAVSGTPSECMKAINKYVTSGVKLPILYPVGNAQDVKLALETITKYI